MLLEDLEELLDWYDFRRSKVDSGESEGELCTTKVVPAACVELTLAPPLPAADPPPTAPVVPGEVTEELLGVGLGGRMSVDELDDELLLFV